MLDPGSNFITPVVFAIASTPDKANTIPAKSSQLRSNPTSGQCQCKTGCLNKPKPTRATTEMTVGAAK